MYKHMTVHFTEPLCKCLEQRIEWAAALRGFNNEIFFIFACQTCGIVHEVPYRLAFMQIDFDTPYPGKKKVPKSTTDQCSATILQLVPKETAGRVD